MIFYRVAEASQTPSRLETKNMGTTLIICIVLGYRLTNDMITWDFTAFSKPFVGVRPPENQNRSAIPNGCNNQSIIGNHLHLVRNIIQFGVLLLPQPLE